MPVSFLRLIELYARPLLMCELDSLLSKYQPFSISSGESSNGSLLSHGETGSSKPV